MKKKLLLKIGGLFLLFSLIGFFFAQLNYQNYQKKINNFIYGLIKNLNEKYPELSEKEIIQLLNNQESGNYLENYRKYGIKEKDPILLSIEKSYKNSLFLILFYCVLISGTFGLFILYYYHKTSKKIKEITNYMQEINEKNYSLKLESNTEGEVSILQNEIYKMTIMLRSESDNLKKEKLSLKESISDISHQLKTPLTSISIMLDNILDNPNMEEEIKLDFIKNVHHQIESINTLIIALLKLSRIEAGVVEFKKEKISATEIIEKALENVEIIKEMKNIVIETHFKENVFFIGDKTWEIEALTNLIKNAIEHSGYGGKIEIKTSKNPIYTQIEIKDYGVGMSEKDLKNIFKRFYKGEHGNNDSIGIGLNLVKNIVEKDNGLIEVKSKIGKGTTFIIKYLK
ncbi:MAG: HAMP domain-containing histidine kinase [Bacilli bacterium]|nr:HAMP domain-containing histidine kinase [Bacilli bacterium]